jgi:mannose-6-phosphate isomerase-like protein (cupin superfamily)
MKMLFAAVLLLVSATWLNASDPQGFALWKAAEIQHSGKELAGTINEQKFANKSLAIYDNHSLTISHREGDGLAELHETQADIFVVESGTATLVVGGTMSDPKTLKPHELRGSSIQGGEMKQIAPGDVVHIPAKVPHQLKIPAGTTFVYLVVKVDIK